jgi:hypothetical protein
MGSYCLSFHIQVHAATNHTRVVAMNATLVLSRRVRPAEEDREQNEHDQDIQLML